MISEGREKPTGLIHYIFDQQAIIIKKGRVALTISDLRHIASGIAIPYTRIRNISRICLQITKNGKFHIKSTVESGDRNSRLAVGCFVH